MARKLPRLQRVLDAPALFSIAYGEIASSIYFALGIITLHALGFTPALLLATGVLFLIVSLSYAEGTAAIRETGGAATFVRIAFNDFWGFVTGWVLFLDYLIVIALSALFLPHYVAGAFFTKLQRPWDVVAGCGVIAGVAVVRLVHRTRLHRWALIVALVDLACRLAADRGATITALTVLEIPMELPLSADMPEKLDDAYDLLDEAKAIGDSYGVNVQTRLIRARSFGRAIVDEAVRRHSEINVMGAPRAGRGRAVFSDTVDFVLKHAPCRVMVVAGQKAA